MSSSSVEFECRVLRTEHRTIEYRTLELDINSYLHVVPNKICSTVQYIQSSTTQRTFNAPCNHQATLMAQTALAQVRTRITPG